MACAVETVQNARESMQVVLAAGEAFTLQGVRVNGLDALAPEVRLQRFETYTDGSVWPDALMPFASIAVPKDTVQSVWVTFGTAAGTPPGTYAGTVMLITDDGLTEVPVTVTVHPICLPDAGQATYSVEYWVSLTGFWWRSPEAEQQRDFIREQYGIERYTPAWWSFAAHVRDVMKQNRINVLYVRTQDLLAAGDTARDADGQWRFDFSVLDRFVRLFLEGGGTKWLAGFHLIQQTEARFVHTVGKGPDGLNRIEDVPLGSAEADAWLDQFLPALWAHLKDMGWDSLWLQHIEDEPADAAPWRYGRAFVRRHMPGVRCLDAVDNQRPAPGLQNAMDLWVPRTDIYEENRAFYDHRQRVGEERWAYTCCVPNTPNWLNKFTDRPVFHSRLLGWACFALGFTGFLHWGFNYWDTNDVWFGMRPDAFFKGDGYIVYPDRARQALLETARLDATRGAAEDYELLRMLAERDAALAYTLAGSVVRSFRDFTWDTQAIMRARSRVLAALAEHMRREAAQG
jgi:hypothetical protein